MDEPVNEAVDQQPAPAMDRRRWRAARSPLAASVSPAIRAAVRRLDETRTAFMAADPGDPPPA